MKPSASESYSVNSTFSRSCVLPPTSSVKPADKSAKSTVGAGNPSASRTTNINHNASSTWRTRSSPAASPRPPISSRTARSNEARESSPLSEAATAKTTITSSMLRVRMRVSSLASRRSCSLVCSCWKWSVPVLEWLMNLQQETTSSGLPVSEQAWRARARALTTPTHW